MTTYSASQQRELDQASGAEMDRRAERRAQFGRIIEGLPWADPIHRLPILLEQLSDEGASTSTAMLLHPSNHSIIGAVQ